MLQEFARKASKIDRYCNKLHAKKEKKKEEQGTEESDDIEGDDSEDTQSEDDFELDMEKMMEGKNECGYVQKNDNQVDRNQTDVNMGKENSELDVNMNREQSSSSEQAEQETSKTAISRVYKVTQIMTRGKIKKI